jgi:hypothetical protein
MSIVAIDRIALDSSGRLRVYPRLAGAGYDYIYRDATSVRWDTSDRGLYVLPVDGFTPLDEFNQIISAVAREYRDSLVIEESSILDIPTELVEKLREISRSRR